jgi:hypothetical protein
LQQILEYLEDPMKVGVHISRFRIDFSGAEKMYRDLASSTGSKMCERFATIADSIKEAKFSEEELIDKVGEGLWHLATSAKCPREILSYISSAKRFETKPR